MTVRSSLPSVCLQMLRKYIGLSDYLHKMLPPEPEDTVIRKGVFSLSEPSAILNWGPSGRYVIQISTCSLHSLNKLFQFINV